MEKLRASCAPLVQWLDSADDDDDDDEEEDQDYKDEIIGIMVLLTGQDRTGQDRVKRNG